MALLIKRSGSPYWYARFQTAGKDRWLSTGRQKKDEAQKELKRLVAESRNEVTLDQQTALLVKMIEALPKDTQPGKREEIVRTILRTQDRKLAIADGWQSWKGGVNREYDPKQNTLLGYEAIWKRFAAWAKQQKLECMHEVGRESAEDYAADLWKSKVSASTFNAHIKFLRSAFTALDRKAGLVSNPWSHIKSKKKVHADGRRNLTLPELQTVMGRAKGNLRVMLSIGLFTGLRLADVLNLKWSNINFHTNFVTTIPVKTSRLKKKTEIPLHAALVQILKQHKAKTKTDCLFAKERAAHAEYTSNITNGIQAFFESCGIQTTEQAEHGQRRRAIVRVGFHSLRHSFVSLCAKAGTPLHVVQKLVGHGNPMLTADVYVHLDDEQRRQAIASLPEFKSSVPR